jgi:hypothetical protein
MWTWESGSQQLNQSGMSMVLVLFLLIFFFSKESTELKEKGLRVRLLVHDLLLLLGLTMKGAFGSLGVGDLMPPAPLVSNLLRFVVSQTNSERAAQ